MIVHFLKNKGRGTATKSIDYMLGKDRDREHAKILQGNPDLSVKIAESLSFKHKYTLGVLSFEEENISEKDKREIMQSFEETLLAGLDKEQYNISWIEHRDKGRLELNFIIPKVDLNSGKAMNPYFDNVDRDLVNTWKNVTNYKYGLTNPDDPEKKQTHIILKDLPRDKTKLSESIGNSLLISIAEGKINDRADVIKHIESLGLEVARVTPKAISIKSPDSGKNIRLKGEMYEENFRYSERYTEQKRAEGIEFRRNFAESHQDEREKLSRLVGKKREFNEKRFGREGQGYSIQNIEQLQPNGKEPERLDSDRNEGKEGQKDRFSPDNSLSNDSFNSDSGQLHAWEVHSDTLPREGRVGTDDRENTLRTQNIGENRHRRGQEGNLHSTKEKSESGITNKRFRTKDFKNSEIEKSAHEKRILEQLRELIVRVANASKYLRSEFVGLTERLRQADDGSSQRKTINSEIEQRESRAGEREPTISGYEQQIKQRESKNNEHQHTAERFTESNIARVKTLAPQAPQSPKELVRGAESKEQSKGR